jgi:hypothetical protein
MLRLLPIIRRVFGLFGKRKAPPSADCVWRSDAARLRGICREVGGFVDDGSSVLVVALAAGALDRLAEALADRAPLRAPSVFVSRAIENAQA